MQEYLNSVVLTFQKKTLSTVCTNLNRLRSAASGTCFSSVVSACAADNGHWELDNWPQKCYTPLKGCTGLGPRSVFGEKTEFDSH